MCMRIGSNASIEDFQKLALMGQPKADKTENMTMPTTLAGICADQNGKSHQIEFGVRKQNGKLDGSELRQALYDAIRQQHVSTTFLDAAGKLLGLGEGEAQNKLREKPLSNREIRNLVNSVKSGVAFEKGKMIEVYDKNNSLENDRQIEGWTVVADTEEWRTGFYKPPVNRPDVANGFEIVDKNTVVADQRKDSSFQKTEDIETILGQLSGDMTERVLAHEINLRNWANEGGNEVLDNIKARQCNAHMALDNLNLVLQQGVRDRDVLTSYFRVARQAWYDFSQILSSNRKLLGPGVTSMIDVIAMRAYKRSEALGRLFYSVMGSISSLSQQTLNKMLNDFTGALDERMLQTDRNRQVMEVLAKRCGSQALRKIADPYLPPQSVEETEERLQQLSEVMTVAAEMARDGVMLKDEHGELQRINCCELMNALCSHITTCQKELDARLQACEELEGQKSQFVAAFNSLSDDLRQAPYFGQVVNDVSEAFNLMKAALASNDGNLRLQAKQAFDRLAQCEVLLKPVVRHLAVTDNGVLSQGDSNQFNRMLQIFCTIHDRFFGIPILTGNLDSDLQSLVNNHVNGMINRLNELVMDFRALHASDDVFQARAWWNTLSDDQRTRLPQFGQMLKDFELARAADLDYYLTPSPEKREQTVDLMMKYIKPGAKEELRKEVRATSQNREIQEAVNEELNRLNDVAVRAMKVSASDQIGHDETGELISSFNDAVLSRVKANITNQDKLDWIAKMDGGLAEGWWRDFGADLQKSLPKVAKIVAELGEVKNLLKQALVNDNDESMRQAAYSKLDKIIETDFSDAFKQIYQVRNRELTENDWQALKDILANAFTLCDLAQGTNHFVNEDGTISPHVEGKIDRLLTDWCYSETLLGGDLFGSNDVHKGGLGALHSQFATVVEQSLNLPGINAIKENHADNCKNLLKLCEKFDKAKSKLLQAIDKNDAAAAMAAAKEFPTPEREKNLFRAVFGEYGLGGELLSVYEELPQELSDIQCKFWRVAAHVAELAAQNLSALDGYAESLLNGADLEEYIDAVMLGLSTENLDSELKGKKLEGEPEPLGMGQTSTALLCKFKDDAGNMTERVFKPESSSNLGMQIGVSRLFGNVSDFSSTTAINILSKKMAEAFGFGNLFVSTHVGKVKGEFGMLMDVAPGTGLSVDAEKVPEKIGEATLESIKNATAEQKRNLQRQVAQQLNRLQWLDLLTGQLDRHANNYHIFVSKDLTQVRVTAIDNDNAFPERVTEVGKFTLDFSDLSLEMIIPSKDQVDAAISAGLITIDEKAGTYTVDFEHLTPELKVAFVGATGVHTPGTPAIMDEAMSKMILHYAERIEDYKKQLSGAKLTDAQIAAAVARLQYAAQIAKDMQTNGGIFKEAEWNDSQKVAQLFQPKDYGDSKLSPAELEAIDTSYISRPSTANVFWFEKEES